MNIVEWIGTAASVIEATAVAGASWAAWKGLTAWRSEMTSRRRAELAEETLSLFYQARDLLAWVRTPMSFGGEGASRPAREGEDDDVRNERNAYFVPIERLSREVEFWGRLDASRYRFMSLFNKEAAKPFESLRMIRSRVETSARSLIRVSGHWRSGAEPPGHQERKDRWEADIGWNPGEEDRLESEIEAAIKAMEATCRPAIIAQAK